MTEVKTIAGTADNHMQVCQPRGLMMLAGNPRLKGQKFFTPFSNLLINVLEYQARK
jgi:hypothetical protein